MTGPRPDYKKILALVSKRAGEGFSIKDLDAYVRDETGGALQNVHDLAGAASQAPQKPTGGLGRTYQNAGIRLGQGATLGFGDELAGLGAAIVPGGRNYQEGRDAARTRIQQAQQETGLVGSGLEMAGGIIPGMLTGGMTPAASVLGRVGQGALLGGGFGAVTGAGYSEGDAKQTAIDALRGGGTGAAVGAVLPVLGAVARKIKTTTSHLFEMLNSPDAAAKRTGMSHAIKAFQNIGMTPEEALAETRKLSRIGGDQVIAADLDPNLAAEARRALTNAPGMSTRILDQMETRGGGRGERLASTAEDAMGITASGVDEAKGAAISGIRKLGERLYGPLRAKSLSPDQQLQVQEFLRDPKLDELDPNIAKALRGMWQDAPPEIPKIQPGMKRPEIEALGYRFEGGRLIPPQPEPQFSFDKLREIRRSLMKAKNAAMADEVTRGFTAPQYAKKVQDITQLMEDFYPGYHTPGGTRVPGFGEANAEMRRAAVSAPSTGHGMEWDFTTRGGGNKASMKVQDAWLEGADALDQPVHQVQKTMSALLEVGGPEAADAFRSGWLEALTTDLRSAKKDGKLGEALLTMGDNINSTYKLMFPRPEDYNRLMSRAGAERAMRRTESALGGARSTVDRNEASRDVQMGVEALGGLATGSWWSRIRLARLAGRQAADQVEQQGNKHLLKFLTSAPSPENQAMWDELQQMFRQQAQRPQGPMLGPAIGGQVAGRIAAPPGQQTTPY